MKGYIIVPRGIGSVCLFVGTWTLAMTGLCCAKALVKTVTERTSKKEEDGIEVPVKTLDLGEDITE